MNKELKEMIWCLVTVYLVLDMMMYAGWIVKYGATPAANGDWFFVGNISNLVLSFF